LMSNLQFSAEAGQLQARDLFSVGFDDSALFVAGRGLERVCREILRDRKVILKRREMVTLGHEAKLYDVVELLARLRWKANAEPLLPSTTRQL